MLTNSYAYRKIREYTGALSAAKEHLRLTIKANIRGIVHDVDPTTYTARRKIGKVIGQHAKNLTNSTSYDLGDVKPSDLPDFSSLRGFSIRFLNCPLTNKVFMRTTRYTPDPSSRDSLHPSVQQTAIRAAGAWFLTEEDADRELTTKWLTLDSDGSLKVERGHTQPEGRNWITVGDKQIWVPKPVNGYHSGEERKFIGSNFDDCEVYAGVELEFNRGSIADRDRPALAARQVTDLTAIVEHDGSITGFEVITGYGFPQDVREKTLRKLFASKVLQGMRTSSHTGMHVHTTKQEGQRDNLKAMWNNVRPVYEKLAGRNYNDYAGMTPFRARRSCIGDTERTLEWRLFKNPNNLPRVMANMQFAWSVAKFAEDHNDPVQWIPYMMELPREQTLELRVFSGLQKSSLMPTDKEIAEVYPRGCGITGVQRALTV